MLFVKLWKNKIFRRRMWWSKTLMKIRTQGCTSSKSNHLGCTAIINQIFSPACAGDWKTGTLKRTPVDCNTLYAFKNLFYNIKLRGLKSLTYASLHSGGEKKWAIGGSVTSEIPPPKILIFKHVIVILFLKLLSHICHKANIIEKCQIFSVHKLSVEKYHFQFFFTWLHGEEISNPH